MVPSYSATLIPYKGTKIDIVAVFGVFSLRMRGNGYYGAYGQKSDPAICSGDVDFLQ